MKSSRKLVCLMLCTILAFTSCSEGGKNQSSSTAEESSQVELAEIKGKSRGRFY